MNRLLLFLCSYCTVSVILLSFPSQIHAQVVFTDDFDDGEFSNWTVIRNFQWNNQNAPCLHYDQPASWQILLQRLGIIIDSPGCFTEIIPHNFELPRDTSYSYSLDITMPESAYMIRQYILRYIDPQNTLAINIHDETLFLEKLVDGVGYTVPNSLAHYPFQDNHTYRFRTEVRTDRTIKLYVDDTLVLDFVDTSPYLDGGVIGLRASVGVDLRTVVWYDNLVVEFLPDTEDLNIPYLSQRDPNWADLEYDHASQWSSQITIDRWGCALTTAVMLLRYHDIVSTPDGSALTPASLNTWLKAQRDGYFGEGLVNWIAISRFSHLFHKSHPEIPSLEYKRKDTAISTVRSEIQQSRPSVLKIPGHFVLAKGQGRDEHVSVYDPFYSSRTTLPIQEVLSIYTFMPSFTDLSYIVIPLDRNDLQFWVEHQGQRYYPFQESGLMPDTDGEIPPAAAQGVRILEIDKPAEDIYNIYIQTSNPSMVSFEVYAYSQDGELELVPVSLWADEQPQVVQLNYSYNNSSVTYETSAHALATELQKSFTNNEITRLYPKTVLTETVSGLLAQQDTHEQTRYVHLFLYYLERLREFISSNAYTRLKNLAEQLD